MGIENCRVLGAESVRVRALPRGGSGATGAVQVEGPAVPETEIGAGGVPGCSGMPGAGIGSLPGKARGFRGQDILEHHGGFDVVMEKVVQ